MKSILLSIKPKYAELIASGKKTIEVRKSAPKEVPFKAYIYCSKAKSRWLLSDYEGAYKNSKGEIVCAQQHIIGEFICDRVIEWKYLPDDVFPSWLRMYYISVDDGEKTCLSYREIEEYGKGKTLYGWHISDLKIYDKPKQLNEFYRPCSYSGICYSCNRFRPNGTPNDKPNDFCDGEITRPPQSYMFVEEINK